MKKMMKNQFVLNFNRPEYVPYPELFISSLAWRIASVPSWKGMTNGKPIGLVYGREDTGSAKIDIKRTNPNLDTTQQTAWREAINDNFDVSSSYEVGDAFVSALKGVASPRMKSQSATPITKHSALLQNTVGVFNKQGPPDIGAIIERMFQMGRPDDDDSSASQRWLSAMNCRNRIDPLLGRLDDTIREGILPKDAPDDAFIESPFVDWGHVSSGFSVDTPFSWLNHNWSLVTSEKWVEALPPRRWVDWATTVLRTGFAMCLLWEMRWYQELSAALLGPSDVEQNDVADAVRLGAPLLDWRATNEGDSLRDIAEPVRAIIAQGVAIRYALDGPNIRYDAPTFSDQVHELRKNQELMDALKESSKASFTSKANSMWESIKYTLIVRSEDGEQSDHYGIIKTRGRFSVVEPASEWIACMASLSCSRPNSIGSLGDLSKSLSALGFRPSRNLLLSSVEKVGLARGAADADQAVEIESAF